MTLSASAEKPTPDPNEPITNDEAAEALVEIETLVSVEDMTDEQKIAYLAAIVRRAARGEDDHA